MFHKFKEEFFSNILSIGNIFFLLIIWYIFTSYSYFPTVLVPTPGMVLEAFFDILKNGYKDISLWVHLGTSMERMLGAYFFAVISAVPLGLYCGCNKKAYAVFVPLIEFYRPLPPLAYYTLLVLWFGIDNTSKIALLYLASFAPLFISGISAVAQVREEYIYAAYTLGATKRQVFLNVIFPACLPSIFTGMRTALGVGYTTLVAAEMVASVSGIGWMVLDASKYLRSDIVFVGILIMGGTGVFLDQIIQFTARKMIPWNGKNS